MKIITGLFLSICAINSFAKEATSNMEVKVNTLSGCQFNIPTQYNFGVVDYTESSKANEFPTNFAPHAEIAMDMTIQCTPGVIYNLVYETEKRDVPTNANGIKTIEGIILNHTDGSTDFLLAYMYLKNENRMLHKNPLEKIGDGTPHIYNLLMGLQNPLERGYMYPSAGVYYGESVMTLTF